MFGEDLAQVVHTGGLGDRPRRRWQLGMDVALDDQRDGVPELAVAEPDLDPGEVLGPVAEVDQASDQGGVYLVFTARLRGDVAGLFGSDK